MVVFFVQLMGLKTDLATAQAEHAAEKQAMKEAADAERCEGTERQSVLPRWTTSFLANIYVIVSDGAPGADVELGCCVYERWQSASVHHGRL